MIANQLQPGDSFQIRGCRYIRSTDKKRGNLIPIIGIATDITFYIEENIEVDDVTPQRLTGKIIKIREQNAYGMTIELDNGVSFNLSCNNGYVYLHFSGITQMEKGYLNIREFEQMKCRYDLANYVSIAYKPTDRR